MAASEKIASFRKTGFFRQLLRISRGTASSKPLRRDTMVYVCEIAPEP